MEKTTEPIKKIVLIGAGNVAFHLGKALQDAGLVILQVYSRTKRSATELSRRMQCPFITDIRQVTDGADLYLFAVSDDALQPLINQFPHQNALLAHTSGSQSMDVFQKAGGNYGVFYPLQTFSKAIVPDFRTIPFCIEAQNEATEERLFQLASALTGRIYKVDSRQRETLHIAAVFSCNFANHLYHIAQRVLQESDLPFEMLLPLIDETVRKIHHQLPDTVQTGPAIRNDQTIIEKHLKRLEAMPDYRNIYTFMTESIINQKKMSNYKSLLTGVSTFIFDVDGVMTDGIVILSQGDMLRTMNVKDGYALQLAVKKGYRIIIISGGSSPAVRTRFEGLGIHEVFLGVGKKTEAFHKLIDETNLDPSATLYMGDDIPDYEVMKEVAVATCPADAAEEIKHICHYISSLPGGRGCVRDVLEQVMKVQGKWFDEDGFQW